MLNFSQFFSSITIVVDWLYKFLIYLGTLFCLPFETFFNLGTTIVVDSVFGFESTTFVVQPLVFGNAIESLFAILGLPKDLPFFAVLVGVVVLSFIFVFVIDFIARIVKIVISS